MITLIVTSFLTIISTILLLRYFYTRDLNPEPREVLVWTFLLGIAIIPPVLLAGFPLRMFLSEDMHPIVFGLYRAFLCAALPEELFKFWVVMIYSARHRAFDL